MTSWQKGNPGFYYFFKNVNKCQIVTTVRLMINSISGSDKITIVSTVSIEGKGEFPTRENQFGCWEEICWIISL
jgi:hypothetical protein